MTVLRWVLAVVGGVFAYWFALLMTLGLLAMAFHTVVTPEQAGRSLWLLSASLLAGSFAAAFVAIAIAPPSGRRIMGPLVVAIATIWAVYGQVTAGHALFAATVEVLAAVGGAALAWLLCARLFRRP